MFIEPFISSQQAADYKYFIRYVNIGQFLVNRRKTNFTEVTLVE